MTGLDKPPSLFLHTPWRHVPFGWMPQHEGIWRKMPYDSPCGIDNILHAVYGHYENPVHVRRARAVHELDSFRRKWADK